jgi:uncharacterized protein YPO0396
MSEHASLKIPEKKASLKETLRLTEELADTITKLNAIADKTERINEMLPAINQSLDRIDSKMEHALDLWIKRLEAQ